MRTDPSIRVYEEYKNAAEKHRAQRSAVRGRPTGKARGFCFVLNHTPAPFLDGFPEYECVATVQELEPGSEATNMMGTTGISHRFLRDNCRRVGKRYLPPVWAEYLKKLEG